MQQNISVTIGGTVFMIGQAAYKKLNTYIKEVRRLFGKHEDSEEILADIEFRIGERLAMLRKRKQAVVTKKNVEEVIERLGKPKELSKALKTGEEEEQKTDAEDNSISTKRFMRDGERGLLGGVAAGLAAYLGAKVWLVRVIMIVLMFIPPFLGLILLGYFLTWLLVAKAETVTDKMQMRGEAISLKSVQVALAKNVKFRSKEDKKKFKDEVEEGLSRAKGAMPKVTRGSTRVLEIGARVILAIVGYSMALGALISLIGVVAAIIIVGLNYDLLFQGLPVTQVLASGEWRFLMMLTGLVATLPLLLVTLMGWTIGSLKNRVFNWFGLLLVILTVVAGAALGAVAVAKVPIAKQVFKENLSTTKGEFKAESVQVQGLVNVKVRREDVDQVGVKVISWGKNADELVEIKMNKGVLKIKGIDESESDCLLCSELVWVEVVTDKETPVEVDYKGGVEFWHDFEVRFD